MNVTAPAASSTPARTLSRPPIGYWTGDANALVVGPDGLVQAARRSNELVYIVATAHGPAAAFGGEAHLGRGGMNGAGSYPLHAVLPPISAETLGDESFCRAHGVRYPYMTGAMANGIGSADIVIAMGKAGLMGSFGAAGLSHQRIEQAIDRIQGELGNLPYCFNLIHTPNEPSIEQGTVDLYLRRGVHLIEAAAFLGLTPMLVQYRLSGLRRGADGFVVAANRVIAKISRAEVAQAFMKPAPEKMVQELLAAGKITAQEAELGREISVADDITVEADSGGHTDNRPLVGLLPLIINLRDRLGTRGTGGHPVRVGAAGGIATPASTAAAFSMGAAYVVTGSVNQAALESGLAAKGKVLLAQAEMTDVMMAPAADMFEMGVKVQVLKRGTMFAMRGQKLYEIYRQYESLEAIPVKERERLEQQLFRRSVDEVWAETQSYWQKMDPRQLTRAAENPKHKMALCFRWYLGLASRWAIQGDETRAVDFQIWCGPAMGAFNDWARGGPLEKPENRNVVNIARNLLEGAAVLQRAESLRAQGIPVPDETFQYPSRVFGPAA
ncbi:MAG: PfaD family polyunsaturated fatty acid/polyketide biosynthesis protein [Myxococcota bacterium]